MAGASSPTTPGVEGSGRTVLACSTSSRKRRQPTKSAPEPSPLGSLIQSGRLHWLHRLCLVLRWHATVSTVPRFQGQGRPPGQAPTRPACGCSSRSGWSWAAAWRAAFTTNTPGISDSSRQPKPSCGGRWRPRPGRRGAPASSQGRITRLGGGQLTLVGTGVVLYGGFWLLVPRERGELS
jgi:hypothetical protein